MNSKWPLIKIDDLKANKKGSISIGPFGSRMKSDCYVDNGIPVIRGTNLAQGPTLKGEFVFITEKKADELGNCNVYQHDLVFPHRGSIGEVGIILNDERYVISSSLMKISCDTQKVNPKFLYYFFKSKIGRHELLKNASQVGTPGIGQPLTSLKGIEIRLPPLFIQNKIEKTLSLINEKITINTQINQDLEEMAQTIFKSWFVDFDPVKAKMRGEQPEGMDADTASLFPDKLVESELGMIPAGWEAGTVGSVTAAKGGYAFKSKQFVDEGNPVIKIKNITSAGTVTTSDCQCVDDDIAKTASRFKLSDGDLLMAMTGATVGKSGIYASDGRDGYLNQRVARFESKVDSSQPCWFTYNLVNKESIFEQIVGTAQGSAQPNISSKGIEQVKTVIPTFDLISKYQELVASLYAKWISNFRENSQLSELRDTLLPKLLSGEIELDK